MIRIFLDDERKPSDAYGPKADNEWIVVKTVDEVITALLQGNVSHLSLDNDLGIGEKEGHTVVTWMIENDIWPTEVVRVHSRNVVRAAYMRDDIKRYFHKK